MRTGLLALCASLMAAGVAHAAPTALALQAPADPKQPEPGRVTLQCVMKTDGGLENCEVAAEAPLNIGLGDAAIQMAQEMRLDPVGEDGESRAGKTVFIPFQIRIRQP